MQTNAAHAQANEEAGDDQTEPNAASEAPPAAPTLDTRLAVLDQYLDEIEGPTRRYFYSWTLLNLGLVGGQAYVAATTDNSARRGSYYIGTALAGAGLALLLLQPAPALRGVKRYRAMPSDSDEQKQAKLEAGEKVLIGQAHADGAASSGVQHVIAVVAALGSGLGVALGYDNGLKEAVVRTVGVFVVAELQIMTRPRGSVVRARKYRAAEVGGLSLAPMVDRYAQGLMLTGRF